MEGNSPKVGNRQDPIQTHIPFLFKPAHRPFFRRLRAPRAFHTSFNPAAERLLSARFLPGLSFFKRFLGRLRPSRSFFRDPLKSNGHDCHRPTRRRKMSRGFQCFLGSDTALEASPKAPASRDASRINVHDALTEINKPEADGSVRVALREKIFLSRFILPLFLASNVGWLCGFFQPSIQLRWPGVFELIQCQLQLFLRGGRRTFQCPSG